MSRANIELQEEIHRKAKINSAIKGVTLISYINSAIEEKLKKEKWQE